MIDRWKQWRLENAYDAVEDAKSAIDWYEGFERDFGGHKGDIRLCQRRLDKAEKRLEKLLKKGSNVKH